MQEQKKTATVENLQPQKTNDIAPCGTFGFQNLTPCADVSDGQAPQKGEVHGHAGQHEHTRAVVNRLSRAIGHLGAVKKMVEEGRDCGEVLVQLSAVKAQITGVSKVILKDHLDHCIADAVREGDEQTIQSLKAAIDKLL